jgi:tripartite-type tricarboxylate transporter receptor subunit TctC
MLGGQMPLFISGPPVCCRHINGGRLKAMATTTGKRSTGLLNTPMFIEAGMPNFNTSEWSGVFVPTSLPQPVLHKLAAEIARMVKLPDVAEKLSTQAPIPVGGYADEFARLVKAETNLRSNVARKIRL